MEEEEKEGEVKGEEDEEGEVKEDKEKKEEGKIKRLNIVKFN